MKSRRQLHLAAQVVDGDRVDLRPGALLLEGNRIIAAGSPAAIGRPDEAEVVDHGGAALIPALVNAHAHLDLTHIGPRPFEGHFDAWIDMVRSERAMTEEDIFRSARTGAILAKSGGTALIGDIAGTQSLAPARALRAAGLGGISFVEVFGIGRSRAKGVEWIEAFHRDNPREEVEGVTLGIQPHAPYSCAPEVYRAALACGRPVATHLAETLEEVRFVSNADGPLAAMLERFGLWDDSIIGWGIHPIAWIDALLEGRSITAAHLNYVDEAALDHLAESAITVVYCPRASAYFGHPREGQPPHAYQAMAARGINVALGTDSMICLDTPDRISILDEMRLLHQRDGAAPRTLLRMATIHGAGALQANEALFTFAPGVSAGLLRLEAGDDDGRTPLARALNRTEAPTWVSPSSWETGA